MWQSKVCPSGFTCQYFQCNLSYDAYPTRLFGLTTKMTVIETQVFESGIIGYLKSCNTQLKWLQARLACLVDLDFPINELLSVMISVRKTRGGFSKFFFISAISFVNLKLKCSACATFYALQYTIYRLRYSQH